MRACIVPIAFEGTSFMSYELNVSESKSDIKMSVYHHIYLPELKSNQCNFPPHKIISFDDIIKQSGH